MNLRKVYFYNLPEFTKVLNRTRFHKPVEINPFTIGEIRREAWDFTGFSTRTVFYTEPVCEGDGATFEETVRKMVGKSKGLFVQIRPQSLLPDEQMQILENYGFQRQDHLNAIIPIREPEQMWSALERDKQKRIRQAKEKHNLQIREDSSPEAIKVFYQMLKTLYKGKRHPIKPLQFFENLVNLMPEGVIRLWFVYSGNIPVTAQLAAFYDKRITALYTATDVCYRDKHGGDLMIWSLLEYGWNNGYKVFDFGGGGNPNRPYQPREYKKRFGTEFINVGRFTKPNSFLYSVTEHLYRLVLR